LCNKIEDSGKVPETEKPKNTRKGAVMNQNRTRFDRLISRIKNNPLVAILLVIGAIVVALSTFTDVTRNLLSLATTPAAVDVTGRWATEELTNPFEERDTFTLRFDFETFGDTLLGAIRRQSTSSRYGYTSTNGILDGKIENDILSFYTAEEALFGNERYTYRDSYHGSVSGDEIAFIRQSDRRTGFPPQRFVARRE